MDPAYSNKKPQLPEPARRARGYRLVLLMALADAINVVEVRFHFGSPIKHLHSSGCPLFQHAHVLCTYQSPIKISRL